MGSCTSFYAPAIQIMVERAYSITPVCPSICPHQRVLAICVKFFRRGHQCPLDTFLVFFRITAFMVKKCWMDVCGASNFVMLLFMDCQVQGI